MSDEKDNPAVEIESENMVTAGIGGTRLHISGPENEVNMVLDAVRQMDQSSPRRSAQMDVSEAIFDDTYARPGESMTDAVARMSERAEKYASTADDLGGRNEASPDSSPKM